jgi:hypothetical protein
MKQRQSGGRMNLKQYQPKAAPTASKTTVVALPTQERLTERRNVLQHMLYILFRKRLFTNR